MILLAAWLALNAAAAVFLIVKYVREQRNGGQR